MPQLGYAPRTFRGLTFRKSDAPDMKQGMQVFWSSQHGGHAVAMDYLTVARHDLRGKFDYIVLHPLDYEALLKSELDAPARNRRRELFRRDRMKELQGFDPLKHFKEMQGQRQEQMKVDDPEKADRGVGLILPK